MTNTKHTPGPFQHNKGTRKIQDSDGNELAMLPLRAGGTSEQDQANGDLFAAAPDLLEALEGMFELVRDCGRGQIERNIDSINAAKAAIAKARGE